MQVKMVKEVRNYVNRTTNFETANIENSQGRRGAAERRFKNRAEKGLASLPEELKELAELRLENPGIFLYGAWRGADPAHYPQRRKPPIKRLQAIARREISWKITGCRVSQQQANAGESLACWKLKEEAGVV